MYCATPHVEIQQSTLYYAGSLGQIVDQAYDVPSIILFFIISLQIWFQSLFFFLINLQKEKSFEWTQSMKIIKKIMLATSDAWLTSHLS